MQGRKKWYVSNMQVSFSTTTRICNDTMLRRFLAFNSKSKTETCIGIANQGNPKGHPQGVLEPPEGPPRPSWTPPRTPTVFVGAGATIFVSATYFNMYDDFRPFGQKIHDLIMMYILDKDILAHTLECCWRRADAAAALRQASLITFMWLYVTK